MAQAGKLVVCGDAGDALGDSLYEAVIYVRGKMKSLGADAHEETMTDADYAAVKELLVKAGLNHDAKQFRRVASKRSCITGMPTPIRNIKDCTSATEGTETKKTRMCDWSTEIEVCHESPISAILWSSLCLCGL